MYGRILRSLTETGRAKERVKNYYHDLKTQKREVHMNRETESIAKNSIFRYRSANHRRLE